MITFDKLTIIVLASNEQESLRETLKIFSNLCAPEDIEEIIVFLKSEDCLAKKEFDKIVSDGFVPFPMRGYIQTIPGFDEMFFEAPKLVNSSHFLLIGADLEMDPNSVPELIEISKKNPEAIVCASKWAKGSQRDGYSFMHMIGVRLINFIARTIIKSNGTELISIFKIVPIELYNQMNFSDKKEALYGLSVKPILYGKQYIEIPTKYVNRSENNSNINTLMYLKHGVDFIKITFRLKHRRKKDSL